jgi:hypothetical protein
MSMGKNGGARGAIYRGRGGHRRGIPRKQRAPSMVAFNSRVMGAEEDGSVPVIEGEKERRISGTDSHA